MLKFFELYKVYVFAFLVCALLVTALGAYFMVSSLSSQLEEEQDRVVTLRTANGLLTAANATMSKDLDTQNEAVRKMKSAQDERSKAAETALLNLLAERNKWRDKYAILLNAPEGKDTCQSIVGLVNGYYEIRREEAIK